MIINLNFKEQMECSGGNGCNCYGVARSLEFIWGPMTADFVNIGSCYGWCCEGLRGRMYSFGVAVPKIDCRDGLPTSPSSGSNGPTESPEFRRRQGSITVGGRIGSDY